MLWIISRKRSPSALCSRCQPSLGGYRFGHELIRGALRRADGPSGDSSTPPGGRSTGVDYAAELDPHAAELAHHFRWPPLPPL